MTSRERETTSTKLQPSRRERGVVEVEGLLNFADWLMREVMDGPSSSHLLKINCLTLTKTFSTKLKFLRGKRRRMIY